LQANWESDLEKEQEKDLKVLERKEAWQILVANSLQTLRNNKEELNEERIDINYFLDRLKQAIAKDPYLDDSSLKSLLAHIRTLPGVGEIESKRADQKYFLKFAEFLSSK
jgi:hypothetical protein